jgi:hypothetical protein
VIKKALLMAQIVFFDASQTSEIFNAEKSKALLEKA